MLEEAAGQGSADAALCATILTKLRASDGSVGGAGRCAAAAEAKPLRQSEARQSRDWRIRFRPGADLLRNGTNPLLLLRELRQLGTLQVKADTAAVPALAELDPRALLCHLGHGVAHSCGAEAIRDVFIFVEDSCELSIEAAAVASSSGLHANRGCRSAGRDALQRRPPRLGQATQAFEYSRARRQAGPVRRPGR